MCVVRYNVGMISLVYINIHVQGTECGSHHAGIQDIVYEVDDNPFPHQMHTKLFPELSLVRE